MDEYGQDLMSELVALGILPRFVISFTLIAIIVLSLRYFLSDKRDEHFLTMTEIVIQVVMIFIISPILVWFSAVAFLSALLEIFASLIIGQPIHWY